MTPEIFVAGLGLLAVITYAVLAGADFGGGVWDLLANGPRKGEQRNAISHAMGPVWEANHVWLIFVIVILFSAFPLAYAALSIGLFIPFHLVLLGIILRGVAFVFRTYSPENTRSIALGLSSRQWGIVFGTASVVTPFLLGLCLGAISAGNLRVSNVGNVTFDGVPPWLTPLSLAMGALALALCAYLAAVYLTNETTGDLREDFRQRAFQAGTVVVALSVLTLPLLFIQARHLWDGLFSMRAAPVFLVGIAAALYSGWSLLLGNYSHARISAVVQIVCLLGGWGLAQYPYLIYPDVTITSAAAPDPTLKFILFTLPFGLALLLPSLWFLFKIFKGEPIKAE